MKLTVLYDGRVDVELDDALIEALVGLGFEFYASGYNFERDVRDLAFERIPTVGEK